MEDITSSYTHNTRANISARLCKIRNGFLTDWTLKDGRGGETRTHNPSYPKRVRYQLRYAPTKFFDENLLRGVDNVSIFCVASKHELHKN
jgi:hypothetical protein